MKCKYFGLCGGCLYQGVSYEEEISLKERFLEQLFGQHISIISSPRCYGYRTRLDFVCAFNKIGFRKYKKFDVVVDIDKCLLGSLKINKLLLKIKNFIREEGIEDYDYIKHQGYLRYICFREAKFTGELMIIFVTASPENKLEKLISKLKPINEITSIIWLINDSYFDSNIGKLYRSYKSPTIKEHLDNIVYTIGPNAFFQSNSFIALKLYKKIRSFVTGNVLDLFCGIGTITLFIAKKVNYVIGVESNPESIELAEKNKKINKIKNVKFIRSDVKNFLKKSSSKFDTIICDPPRAGLLNNIKYINKFQPKRLILVSCNPKTLKDDLLRIVGYKIILYQGYDMFPRTKHVEMLCVLERKD